MIYIELLGMDLGVLLLQICLVAFIFDTTILIINKSSEKWEFYSELSINTGTVALIFSFIYFSFSVVSSDYSFIYVITYVNNSMDILMRISAIWSGQAGSYFFWVFLVVIINIVFRNLFRNYVHETFFRRSFVLMTFQLIILIALTFMSDPFKLSTVMQTDGIGLNPELMNVWNLIHPFIIFVGYAMCLIPMVIGIVRISILENSKVPIFEGKERLDKFFELMVSLAWLILSSGIIIGGYWAYTTLGWGGFWAWDPIETASLISWLFLTLYFHGKPFYRKNEYLGNYIISMSYIGVLFTTYLTRSGILSSVHAYRPEATLESILDILIPQNTFLMSIILRIIPNDKILLLFIVIIALFLIPHILGIKKGEIKEIPLMLGKTDFQEAKSRRTALKISFLAAFIGTFFIILVLIFPVIYDIIGYIVTLSPDGFSSRIALEQSYYNTVITIFGGIMLLAQFFCTYYPRISIKRKYGIIIGGVTTGLLFTISGILYRNGFLTSLLGQKNPILTFFSNFWTTSDKANLVIPLILLGIIGLIAEFIRIALTEERHVIRKTSQIMLHLSFLIILLGALLSANMTTTHNLDFIQLGRYEIPGTSISIEILDLNRTFPESGINSVEYKTSFRIFEGSRVIGSGISRLAYDQSNRQDITVTIISDLITDFYVVTIATYEDTMSNDFVASSLQIKIIPYINILWIGCIMLHLAIIPLTIGRYIQLKKIFATTNEDVTKDNNEE